MDTQLKEAYPICIENKCLWKTDLAQIGIKDEDGTKCIQVTDCSLAHFTIENINKKELAILAIDKCIFDDQSGHKKCDFAFYDEEIFVFVEIKDTYKRRPTHKKQAKLQLAATIEYFIAQLNFEGYQLQAIISWRFMPARPVASTAMQDARVAFLENYNVLLMEGNKFILA